MSSVYNTLVGSLGAPGGKTIYAGNYNVRKTGPFASGLLKNLKPDPMGMTILAGNAKAAGQLGPSNIAKLRNKNKSRKNKNRNKNKSRKNKNRNKNKSRKNKNRK